MNERTLGVKRKAISFAEIEIENVRREIFYRTLAFALYRIYFYC